MRSFRTGTTQGATGPMLDSFEASGHAGRMSAQFHWVSIANMVLNGFAYGGALIVIWIGWMRTRQLAWLVMGAWVLSVLAGMGLQAVYFRLLQVTGAGVTAQHYEWFSWIQVARSVVSGALLCLGLWLFAIRSEAVRKAD